MSHEFHCCIVALPVLVRAASGIATYTAAAAAATGSKQLEAPQNIPTRHLVVARKLEELCTSSILCITQRAGASFTDGVASAKAVGA